MSSCKGEPESVAISPIKSGPGALKTSCKSGGLATPLPCVINALEGEASCKVRRRERVVFRQYPGWACCQRRTAHPAALPLLGGGHILIHTQQ